MKFLMTLLGLGITTAMATGTTLYDFEIGGIDGKELDLNDYKGKVVLVVNVASKCGLTKQYEGLQALYEEYQDKGLVILGVPSNDFGRQEPGSDAEIVEFCTTKFDVTFPMTTKVSVKGDQAHPIYAWLTEAAGGPKWNFHKYLIDKNGNLIAGFGSRTKPDAKELREAIDQALAN